MPYIIILLYSFGATGPFIIFGILSGISALSMLSLKDTTDIDLDNT